MPLRPASQSIRPRGTSANWHRVQRSQDLPPLPHFSATRNIGTPYLRRSLAARARRTSGDEADTLKLYVVERSSGPPVSLTVTEHVPGAVVSTSKPANGPTAGKFAKVGVPGGFSCG